MSFVKKQNISIVVDEKDGKKYYKTIGELVTMSGNDGEYQFAKLWGPGGVVNAKIFDQDNNQNTNQQNNGQQFGNNQQNTQQNTQQQQQGYGSQQNQGQQFNPGQGGFQQ